MRHKIILMLLGLMLSQLTTAQNPLRFQESIEVFKNMEIPEGALTVITGSSSVRFWNSVDADCADEHIVNTGFGGSEASDLLYHLDAAVLRFRPKKVFIYEGDNDINSGKTPESTLKTMSQIVAKILTSLPNVEVFIIGAKPSPSRWQHQQRYLELNRLLATYCATMDQVNYIDVWFPMLNQNGKPKPEIFVADSLHMNSKGYEIWTKAICPSMQ